MYISQKSWDLISISTETLRKVLICSANFCKHVNVVENNHLTLIMTIIEYLKFCCYLNAPYRTRFTDKTLPYKTNIGLRNNL